MGALTKKERDGLDDVFLSIHSREEKYQKIKEISNLIINHNSKQKLINLYKQAKYGLKETKISYFLEQYYKKKKNLSK
ncbi:hypothetical protein [Sulfurimonas sp.]|uniref:hypothetical protein n=1 Tax=Sulfurimonas sp. TaxID=2022749 RepID=UPI002613EA24|nr:hypothetical protein [Sulfurimonas sp.]